MRATVAFWLNILGPDVNGGCYQRNDAMPAA
jgi:hypothetical protein